MGCDTYAFDHVVDYGYVMKIDLQDIMNAVIPLSMFTDYESLFKDIVKSTIATDKRLMIDVKAAREA